MSRRAFRASVDDPRPVAAWWMVGVASTTLAITGQVAPWTLAGAVAAFAYSLTRRLQARSWQKSPFVLNTVLLSILAVSFVIWLEQQPSTIALAHFAVLTQGLQLLDARPRKSEFLLVTLALFQVILASNLTDSVLFPPLLLLFLLSTTWTLMVHTLRSEAIEAGDRRAGPDVTRGGLFRITLVASAASIVLALILFVTLPRFRTSMVHARAGQTRAVAGFTNHVRLGTIGKIRQDSTVVLRVETLEGEPPPEGRGYWRGIAFDHFDGERWSVTPPIRSAPGGSPAFGIPLGRGEAELPILQRIVREPVQGGVLFGAGRAHHVRGSVRRIETDSNGSLYGPDDQDERIRYEIRTDLRQPDDARLARDVVALPARNGERLLELPEMSPEVNALAERIVADSANDAARARALETHLRESGRYTDMPPDMRAGGARSPVEGFLLGELSGHCEYFASGMVVLARNVGLPARLVNGFAGGQRNTIGGFTELMSSDAHAWVEIHFEEAGWVRYDPTPAVSRQRSAPEAGLGTRLAELGSAVELWWYQSVLDFDTSDQVHAIRTGWMAWQAFRGEGAGGGARTAGGYKTPKLTLPSEAVLPSLLTVALLLAVGAAVLRRRRSRSNEPELPKSYATALKLLERRGLCRPRSASARDFARDVSRALPGDGGAAFDALTNSYLAVRFGAHPPSAGAPELTALRLHLRRTSPRELRAKLTPPSSPT